jgi:hypothetical protein
LSVRGRNHRSRRRENDHLHSKFKFFLRNHQHKGTPFEKALQSAGFVKSKYPHIGLFDKDWQNITYGTENRKAREIYECGAVIVVYPHCFSPPWWYDGMLPVRDFTSCIMVVGKGQKEATEIFVDRRVEITGWPWCPQKAFEPTNGEKILFAPTHPAGENLREEAAEANARIQEELLNLNLDVTCRHIGELEHQGLKYTDKWTWVRGQPDGSFRDIDDADLVIAEGTFMYISIARGKPTIGVNQHLPIRSNVPGKSILPANWDLYGDDLAYPLNYGERSLYDLMDMAQTEQSEWRERFIGRDMDGGEFAELIVNLYKEYRL